MSRARGLFPAVLAVAFGIGNGVYVFLPTFKEQQLEKQGLTKKEFDTQHSSSGSNQENSDLSPSSQIKALEKPDVVAKAEQLPTQSSWWPSLWAGKPSSQSQIMTPPAAAEVDRDQLPEKKTK